MEMHMFGSGGLHERLAPLPDTRRVRTPVKGMRLSFKASACAELAGIAAEVIEIWPCFRPHDCVVTLEYAQPIGLEHAFGRRIHAFLSELEPGNAQDQPRNASFDTCSSAG